MTSPPGHRVVAPGQTIQSAEWGNLVWDQSVNRFASVADRNAQWAAPPDGVRCYTVAEKWFWRRVNGAWRSDVAARGATFDGASDANANAVVAWPGGPFPFTPTGVATMPTMAGGTPPLILRLISKDATGMVVQVLGDAGGGVLGPLRSAVIQFSYVISFD